MLWQPRQSFIPKIISQPTSFVIFSGSTNVIVRTIRRALEDSKEAYDNDGATSWEELKPYIDEMKHNIADILLPKPQTGTIEQTQSISPEQIQEDRDNAILAEVASMMREVFGIYWASKLFQSLWDAFNQSPRVIELRAKFRDKATDLIPPSPAFRILETARVPLYPYLGHVKVLIKSMDTLLGSNHKNPIIEEKAILKIRNDVDVELWAIQQRFQMPLTRGLGYDEENNLAHAVLDLCNKTIERLSKVRWVTDTYITWIRAIVRWLSDDLNPSCVTQILDTVHNTIRGTDKIRASIVDDPDEERQETNAFPL